VVVDREVVMSQKLDLSTVPGPVIEALTRAWPEQVEEILGSLRFAGDHYCFERWGMYVGVEFDGYIHT
jgi:hypothetical protein